jgi:anthranilate synthase component 1/anthranilate synthase
MPQGAVASLSPELFLRRKGRAVVSRPIKGTQRRSPDERRARQQRAKLERSAKNRAENVMIVDLMRNDLSRVCAVGSVEVPRLLAAEPHPGVWHLVSDVRGTLGGQASDGDLIRATFPPGSVTGAPKVRAVEIIHELEASPREVYTGAVGYRSPVAGLELNVAIRTFEFHSGRVWLGSGGGIVADSAADDEYAECLLKAGPLIHAIGGRLSDGRGPAPGADAGPGGAALRASLRPRPAAGILTSPWITVRPTGGPHRAGPVTVLIDNYDSFTYNLAHMLAACGCRVEVVRNDEVSAEQVASFGPAGVMISPGPCTPAEAGISVDVVRACGGRVPLLGVCLGHQAIAAAFGARIVAAPRPVHGQTSAITHDGRGFLAGLPQPFEATRYHSLIVDESTLPGCLTVTATADGRIPMGLRHRAQPTEGVQFHPESILTPCGETIIRNFAQALLGTALGRPRHGSARAQGGVPGIAGCAGGVPVRR